MRQERERQMQDEFDRQRQVDMARAGAEGSDKRSNILAVAVAAATTLMSRMVYFRSPRSNNQPKSLRYNGVDDQELNWWLDCYASLSDFTIVVHSALPVPS